LLNMVIEFGTAVYRSADIYKPPLTGKPWPAAVDNIALLHQM